MNKSVNISQMIPLIKEAITNGNEVKLTPNGSSMLPFLCDKDEVVLVSPNKKLKKNDVVFYYRKRTGIYVLHRLIKFSANGEYIFCGDNQFDEETGVTDNDVIAVVKRVKKENKIENLNSAAYKLYCTFLPLRRFYKKVRFHLLKR